MYLFQCPDIKIAKKFFFRKHIPYPHVKLTWHQGMRNAQRVTRQFCREIRQTRLIMWPNSNSVTVTWSHWSHGDWKEISQSISGHTSWRPHLTVYQNVLRGIFRCIRAIRHQSNAGYTSKLTTYYIIARNEYLCAIIMWLTRKIGGIIGILVDFK